MREVDIAEILFDDLAWPDLGTEGEVDVKGFRARIADQPTAICLREVFEHLKEPIRVEYKSLFETYNVWLIPHRVAIIRHAGLAEPSSVGVEVRYLDDQARSHDESPRGFDGKTRSIQALLPSFEYIEHGSLNVGGIFSFSGTATAERDEPLGATATMDIGGLSFRATGGGGLRFRFGSTVSTPFIQAVGIGSSECQWRFDKRDIPLYGRDIQTWAAVAVPKQWSLLNYEMRFYIVVRTIFVPTRIRCDWTPVSCQLLPITTMFESRTEPLCAG